MRQMINKRTGRVAVYDPELVTDGRWEEYFPPEQPKEKPKGVTIKKLKGIGTLEVKPTKETADEGVEHKA